MWRIREPTIKSDLNHIALITAARDLADIGGINAIGVARVARVVGVAKGTVQAHFRSLTGLRLAVIDSWAQLMYRHAVLTNRSYGITRLRRGLIEWLVLHASMSIPLRGLN